MSAIEQCSKQPSSRSRGMKRERVVLNYVRSTNSTSKDDEQFTTITTTLVATVVVPVSTKTTTPTCTSTSKVHLILPTSSWSTTSIHPSSSSGLLPAPSNPIPSNSLPSTAEPHVTSSSYSSTIVGIIIAVIAVFFILAAVVAWRKRRRPPVTPSVGDRPSLPKFSFERENEGPLKTSGTFEDKFTRLDKTHSPGVRWVADWHGNTDQTPQARASRLLFAHSFDHAITDQTLATHTKASRGSMLLFAQSFGPSLTKATVVRTFITDLVDELPVAVGQRLNVLAEYDDGWTFCVNERGEQGMVPIDCLRIQKKVVSSAAEISTRES